MCIYIYICRYILYPHDSPIWRVGQCGILFTFRRIVIRCSKRSSFLGSVTRADPRDGSDWPTQVAGASGLKTPSSYFFAPRKRTRPSPGFYILTPGYKLKPRVLSIPPKKLEPLGLSLSWGGHNLVSVDPSAQSSTFCGFRGKPNLISTKKLKSKDPTREQPRLSAELRPTPRLTPPPLEPAASGTSSLSGTAGTGTGATGARRASGRTSLGSGAPDGAAALLFSGSEIRCMAEIEIHVAPFRNPGF